MGNDGGVIAVKRKFMRHANLKAKEEQKDHEISRVERAQMCALSGEILREPIVVCALGNLYNKEAVLHHLLNKTMPERFQHITSLKDVLACKLSKKLTQQQEVERVLYYCPVTMMDLNGKQPFVVMSSCGCVLSERAVKEVPSKECLNCGSKNENGAIKLFIPEELYTVQQIQILERKSQKKHLKEELKKKKRTTSGVEDSVASDECEKEKKKQRKDKKHCMNETSSNRKSTGVSIADEASATIQQTKQKNHVFASLFAKDKSESTKNAKELLMAIGGMRYTLS